MIFFFFVNLVLKHKSAYQSKNSAENVQLQFRKLSIDNVI